MHKAFCWINGAIGAALVLAGFMLSQIPWIDIIQSTHTDAFHLIQTHFILTGLISIWASSTTNRAGLMVSVNMLAIGVNAWLAFLAVTSGDMRLYWPVVFAIASSLNLLYLLKLDSAPSKTEAQENEATLEDGLDHGLVSPAFGVVSAAGFFHGALLKLGLIILIALLTFGLLFFGVIYVVLLKRVIFENALISFSKLIEYFLGGSAKESLIEVGLYVAVIAVVYGALYFFEALLGLMMRSRATHAAPDIDRDLSVQERSYIRCSLGVLLDYLDQKHFNHKWRNLYILGSLFVFVGMFAAPIGAFFLELATGSVLTDRRIGTVEPLFYSGPLYIGGVAASALAGMGVVWSLFQWLGRRIPDFGEYMFAEAGWNSMNARPREPNELLWVMVRHVRVRALSIGKPFNPYRFLCAAFSERESLVYKTTIFFSVLTVLLAIADLARFELVDLRGITYSKYFHFQVRNVKFADLDRIEMRCVLYKPDDGGDVNLRLDYVLVKDGEFRVDLLSKNTIDDLLPRLEELDAMLQGLSIQAVRAPSAGFLQGGRSSFVAGCAEEIGQRFRPEVADRLNNVLRVTDFSDSSPNS